MSEAFICDAIRTPIGRYGGALASIRTDDLGAIPLKTLMERNQGVDWGALEDVYYGCVNQAGEDNRNVARMALLLAGLPKEVTGATGVESMTRAPFVINKADSAFSRSARIEDTTIGWRFVNPKMKAQHGIDAMADTAENLADEHKIARGDQDAFALRSQQRWARAQAGGFFKSEVIAVTIAGKKGTSTVVDKDEHPRPETTLEALTKLKPVTRENGTVTAGNASGVNDGAGAMIIASEAAAKKHGLVPKARILAMATAGVAPRIMGIGPVPATRKVLARTGLTLKQMEVIELNEAFAAQSLAVTRELGIADDAAHMNPNGGAIAIGHPLGASGVRLVMTAMYQLQAIRGRYALCSMCIGVGQGIAVVIERV